MDRDTSSPAARNRQHTLPFALTCFVSALLLFLVQPLLGKFILPWFGGTPGVWTTAMLLFQALLLGGYLYAHICTRLLQRGLGRWVFSLHVALVVLSLGFLPIIPSDALRPHGGDAPIPRILLLLVRTVGVPYFLLAATGPLSQAWLSVRGGSPYRLYALSNAGSLLALFGYPLVMEPLFPVTTQAKLWSLGFGLLLPLWLLCAYQGLLKP
ncbi:MAG TPA: ferrichrome ABC transporter permease, partial [Pseudomonadota bacterium]|nr:ferrichrome ABC transporter permease [Pseudomonadota bacterium]